MVSVQDLHQPRAFQARKKLYRKQRDSFRNNPVAMEELEKWKSESVECCYTELKGLIPENYVGKRRRDKIFAKCDTWFSEFKSHSDAASILDESECSYIIGNQTSYDKRQYPRWLDPRYRPGINTPEGQGFGHCFVIPKKRVFNIVDPEATAKGGTLVKELRDHFINFWENNGSRRVLEHTSSVFNEQSTKLKDQAMGSNVHQQLLSELNADFDRLAQKFCELKAEDFEFAFHAWPDNSVGHLHLHVFPKQWSFRRFSATQHDWKTIPIEAVLEVEQEDNATGGALKK